MRQLRGFLTRIPCRSRVTIGPSADKRIKPAHPEQNGRHERTHLTLKKEATKPAGKNFLQQQARFDAFTCVYNHERPHQAHILPQVHRTMHAGRHRHHNPNMRHPNQH
jgi:hypothetical protein